MPRDADLEATIDALNDVTTAMIDLLARVQAVSDPTERDALRGAFAVRVDEIRADIVHRHALSERQAMALTARALACIGEVARATTVNT